MQPEVIDIDMKQYLSLETNLEKSIKFKEIIQQKKNISLKGNLEDLSG
jgi:hypothetical protein